MAGGRERWMAARRAGKQVLLAALLVILLLIWPVGCTTTIIPPAQPGDPVYVYLLDHGHTPSLVIPTPEGELARYAFGDMRYYGEARRNIFTGALAMLVPTTGGLGRGVFPDPSSPDQVLARMPVHVEHFYPIEVEREAAYRLQAQLETRYHEQIHTQVVNPGARLDFVEIDRRYTWFYNSNHAVADWLRALECDVRGPAFVSRWVLEASEGDARRGSP